MELVNCLGNGSISTLATHYTVDCCVDLQWHSVKALHRCAHQRTMVCGGGWKGETVISSCDKMCLKGAFKKTDCYIEHWLVTKLQVHGIYFFNYERREVCRLQLPYGISYAILSKLNFVLATVSFLLKILRPCSLCGLPLPINNITLKVSHYLPRGLFNSSATRGTGIPHYHTPCINHEDEECTS